MFKVWGSGLTGITVVGFRVSQGWLGVGGNPPGLRV